VTALIPPSVWLECDADQFVAWLEAGVLAPETEPLPTEHESWRNPRRAIIRHLERHYSRSAAQIAKVLHMNRHGVNRVETRGFSARFR